MVIKYLLEKEWKQFFRHKFMPKLVVIFPLMIMVFMPWATTLDIRDINTVVVDHDVTETSRQFTRTINASSYFLLQDVVAGYDEAIDMMEFGDADLILEIPAGFEDEYAQTGAANILVAINTVNTTKGVLGRAYIQMLAAQLPPAVSGP